MTLRTTVALVVFACGLAACGGGDPPARADASMQGGRALAGVRREPAGMVAAGEPGSRMRASSSSAAAEENRMGGTAALPPATLDDPEPAVREQAVYGLEPEGGGLELLTAAARDSDPGVRLAAVMQLGAGEGEDVWHPLAEALRDPDSSVVEEALVALAALGDARAAPHVRPLLSHADEEIRSLAADTLAALEPER